jgi:hypothetical protein
MTKTPHNASACSQSRTLALNSNYQRLNGLALAILLVGIPSTHNLLTRPPEGRSKKFTKLQR